MTQPAWYSAEHGDDSTIFGAKDYSAALAKVLDTDRPGANRKHNITEAGTLIAAYLKDNVWSKVGAGLKTDIDKKNTDGWYSSIYGEKNLYDLSDYAAWKSWGRTDKQIWQQVFKGKGKYKSTADYNKLDEDAKKETFNVDLLSSANKPGQTKGLWEILDLGWKAQWDAAGNTKFPGTGSGGSSSTTTTTTTTDDDDDEEFVDADVDAENYVKKTSTASATTGTYSAGTRKTISDYTTPANITDLNKKRATNPIRKGLTQSLQSSKFKKRLKKVRGTKDLKREVRYPTT